MKRNIRILCLLLALLMVLPLAVACGDGDSEEKSTSSTKPGNPTPDDQDPLQELGYYDNEEIVINVSKMSYADVPSSYQFIQGPDSITSDAVLNEAYDRNAKASETLGIQPRYVYSTLLYNEVLPDIQTKVLAPGRNTPDLYIDQLYGMIRAQQAGFLKNALDEGTVIDFTTKGWYQEYMKAFNFNSSEKLYLLAGDYTIDVIRLLNTMGCNLTMFENIFFKSGGKKLFYDTVKNGEWTYDKLMEWSEKAYSDNGKTAGQMDQEDQLGLISCNKATNVMAWLPAVDVAMYDIDDQGRWSVHATNDTRAINAINKLIDLLGSTNGVLFAMNGHEITDENESRAVFINGHALFTSGVLLSAMETAHYQEMEDEKCVLPYPKLDAEDSYSVTSHDGARVGAILISTQKFKQTTAWLQGMALTSTNVLNEYYNVTLKFKYGSDLNTTKLLDIIYESISPPYYITISAITATMKTTTASPLSFWYQGDSLPASNTYVSLYAAIKSPLGVALKDFQSAFNKLD